MNDRQRLVTVGRFENAFEAEQAKLLLEEEGIQTVLFGGDLMANLPEMGLVNMVLQVFEEDRTRAEKILEERFPPLAESDEGDIDEEDWSEEGPGEADE